MDSLAVFLLIAGALALYGVLLRRGIGVSMLAGFDAGDYARIVDKDRFHRIASDLVLATALLLAAMGAALWRWPGAIWALTAFPLAAQFVIIVGIVAIARLPRSKA